MKTLATCTALLMASAALSMTATAQQNPPASQSAGQQGGAQQAGDLSKSLGELDRVRQQISAASGDQVQTHIEPAKNALKNVQAGLQGMQGQQATAVNNSLVKAQEALIAPQPDKNRIVQALDAASRDARALQGQASGQSGSNQATAQIQVEQQSPQIGVQQPAPQISVQQPPPQVTVKQPPPQVKIEQPQPQVSVQQAEPKVTVEQNQPKVKVEQQGQAQVDVQKPGAPQVTTQAPQGNAQTGASGQGQGNLSGLTRNQLMDKNIYAADNSNVGEVADVVIGPDSRVTAVLADVGGFLGIGERRVAIPIDKLRLEGDRLKSDLTKEQVNAMPEHEGEAD
jgi:hypothetical protein